MLTSIDVSWRKLDFCSMRELSVGWLGVVLYGMVYRMFKVGIFQVCVQLLTSGYHMIKVDIEIKKIA